MPSLYYTATQTYDDAMMELFGIDFGDPAMETGTSGTTRAVATVPDAVYQQILEIFRQV